MFSLDGYQSLHRAAAVVRRSDRGALRVTGADRATWLQGLLTNDVVALRPGDSCYAAYLTPQGRMITDLQVASLDECLLLDVPASLATALRERLDGLIFTEDTQVVDESTGIDIWGVYGPDAGAILHHDPSVVPDRTIGVSGVTLYLDRGRTLPRSVSHLPEVDLDTLEVLRIEGGTPRFLVDMDEHTIPLEAGIEGRAISFTKGCYVGQEVIVRVTERGGGRVAKKLVRLSIAAGAVGAGARLMSEDRDIGRVTSAAYSPMLGSVAALGYVHRDFITPGTALTVADGGSNAAAVVR